MNAFSVVREPGAHASQRRHNSTSSLFSPFSSFFSRVKASPALSADEATETFRAALSASPLDIDSLTASYDVISAAPSPSDSLPEEQLAEALRALSRSSPKPAVLALARKIYGELQEKPGSRFMEGYKGIMVKILARNGMAEEALNLAKILPVSAVSWRDLLRAATTHRPALINQILPPLRQTLSLTSEDYDLVFRALRLSLTSSDPSWTRAELDSLLDDIRTRDIELSAYANEELMRIHLALGDLEQAQQIVTRLGSASGLSLGSWNAIIELDIARSDATGLEETIQKMRDAGFDAPQRALSFLSCRALTQTIASRSSVGFVDIVSSVEAAERNSGTTAQSDVWADVVRLYLAEVKQHDALDVAVQIYHETLSRGLETSAELAKNLIIPLCNGRQQVKLDVAMRIYDEYTSLPSWMDGSVSPQDRERFAAVYQYLLIACARSTPPAVGIAIRLLSDMRAHAIEITPTNLVSLLILLMKSSNDHTAAFDIYAHFYALDPSAIDEQGYKAILAAYLNLNSERSPYPPPEMFVDMMRDMHRAGYQPGSYLLSSLLKQYGHACTRFRRRISRTSRASKTTDDSGVDENEIRINVELQLDHVAQSIRSIHTLIKLDPLISPDIPLLSALMDAYARVAAFSECFEVWDELVQRRHREPTSTVKQSYAAGINVVLDACGWSYSLVRGRKAWAWAKRWDLIWEKKQYDSWVECLCRNGQVEEAGKVVLDEMKSSGASPTATATTTGRAGNGIPESDVESARTILKFGRREMASGKSHQAVREFVRRLEKERKGWFDQLKAEGEIREDML
ncbi:hypothetical protein I317_02232 [Kwoniella heveanensis CBS 569]|nr:hypothetical protein I317_02232 [Kwoniella heveanensis CBS 569]